MAEDKPEFDSVTRVVEVSIRIITMGIEDVLNKASGADLRKVVSLVDQLWDDRNKITEVVGLVWDNRDQFSAALDFVQDHGDELIDLLKRLPELLATAGEALDAAGAGAETASVFLIGAPATGKTGKGASTVAVTTLTDTAADALDRCQTELHGVESMISGLGRQVDALGILPKSIRDIGGGAARVAAVADDLATVADQLRQLGVSVNDAGADLGKVGELLQHSGSALQSLTSSAASPKTTRPKPPQKAKSKSAKKSSTKKTSSKTPKKKSTAKKSTAKKKSSNKTSTISKSSRSGSKANIKVPAGRKR